IHCIFFFFFFSSRRRHTRWPRDWSSDVCSSDLSSARNKKCEMNCRDFRLRKVSDRDNKCDATIDRRVPDRDSRNVVFHLRPSSRSEERRVGKECRYWWSRGHEREKNGKWELGVE